jgi:ParB family chromosome partitioning protein
MRASEPSDVLLLQDLRGVPIEKAPSNAARHSCDSPEWYTPSPYVEAARAVMGGIDLDPASHEEANRTVKAKRFFTVEDDGLSQPWSGRVFLNPPGGLVKEFWAALMHMWCSDAIDQAIWIGYSLEQMQTLQSAGGAMPSPAEFSICFPRRRIAFVENEAKRAERIAKLEAAGKRANRGSLPSHANYVVYLGHNPSKFVTEFSAFGAVVIR